MEVSFDSVIQAAVRGGGKPSEEIYLEGNQLVGKARFTGGVVDGQILELPRFSEGFRKLVHSSGVSVKAQRADAATVDFSLQHWGKTSKYESGTRLRIPCPAAAGSGSFKMAITCKRLILVYKDSGNAAFGTAEIEADGQLKKAADPHEINWTHCNAVILIHEQTAGEHRIEIKVAAGHESKQFTVLGFGYVS